MVQCFSLCVCVCTAANGICLLCWCLIKKKKSGRKERAKVQPSLQMRARIHMCLCVRFSHMHVHSRTTIARQSNGNEMGRKRTKIEHPACKKFYCLQHSPHFPSIKCFSMNAIECKPFERYAFYLSCITNCIYVKSTFHSFPFHAYDEGTQFAL